LDWIDWPFDVDLGPCVWKQELELEKLVLVAENYSWPISSNYAYTHQGEQRGKTERLGPDNDQGSSSQGAEKASKHNCVCIVQHGYEFRTTLVYRKGSMEEIARLKKGRMKI
jgi:hypothetical protein